MAEALCWFMLEHLMKQDSGFAKGPGRRGYLHRFKRTIHVLDSTTIQLGANCMDWVQHRRRKAAAKCHLRFYLQSFLASCAIIDTAKYHDNTKAHELCATLKAGEIIMFDKDYLDFEHLRELSERGIFWVSRAKDNMSCEVVETLQLADFFGYTENAIRWQTWTGLLVHLLLRYIAHMHSWGHSFIRLFTVLRATMWKYWNLDDLMILYGTATCEKVPQMNCIR